MAIIVPYGDTQAHGSLGDSVTFRRRRGKVVFQKKAHPKQPNTPGQQAQKEKFRAAWASYHSLSPGDLEYYRALAAELGTTAANLYLSLYLKGELASRTPLTQAKTITDIDITVPVSAIPYGLVFNHWFQDYDRHPSFNPGVTFDNENVFTPGHTCTAYQIAKLRVKKFAGGPTSIPKGYQLTYWWTNMSDEPKTNLMKLPLINFPTWPPLHPADNPSVKQITGLPAGYGFTGSSDMKIYVHWKSGGIWSEPSAYCQLDLPGNTFHPGLVAPTHEKMRIKIQEFAGEPGEVLAGAWLTINWIDYNGLVHEDFISLGPAVLGPFGTKYYYVDNNLAVYDDEELTEFSWAWYEETDQWFYIADDFSLYYDPCLHQLASTPYI